MVRSLQTGALKRIVAPRLALSWLILAAVAVAGCRVPSRSTASPGAAVPPERAKKELIVFAAASLTEAFTDLGQGFQESHPGATVVFNFAGSQILRAQIEDGAVADVFASANASELEALVANGNVDAEGGREFAANRLIVILPEDNPAGIETLGDLAPAGVKIVLGAEEVPVGKYARQALTNLNAAWGPAYAESVLANVVSNEENARQIVAKVSLGEADAGIVYSTDAVADRSLATVAIDDAYNVTAEYPLAVLRQAPEAELARQFVEFILSPEGQTILQAHGFLPREPR
jgi:molybdate transport system substrate-binding protein